MYAIRPVAGPAQAAATVFLHLPDGLLAQEHHSYRCTGAHLEEETRLNSGGVVALLAGSAKNVSMGFNLIWRYQVGI